MYKHSEEKDAGDEGADTIPTDNADEETAGQSATNDAEDQSEPASAEPSLETSNSENNTTEQSTSAATPSTAEDTLQTLEPEEVPATTPSAPPQDNPFSSLYQVDDPYIDDDDEDNKYTALCIPCSNVPSFESTTTTTTTTTPSNTSTSESSSPSTNNNPQPNHRFVPATCAICLLQYSPGCYVTWSSNKECTHAFHRDCILMWLLKKEEPYLCPCCRREFVLESMLNDDGGDDSAAAQGRGGEINGGRNEDARREQPIFYLGAD